MAFGDDDRRLLDENDPQRRYYRDEMMIRMRRPRVWRWGFAIGVVLLGAALVALVVPNFNRRASNTGGASAGIPGGAGDHVEGGPAIGTSGGDFGSAAGQAASDQAIVKLKTIFDSKDATALVGQRIDVETRVRDIGNDVAFWIGPDDANRLLVVPDRDTRSSQQRQVGLPSLRQVVDVREGQPVRIDGVIEPIPYGEATYSWNLTRDDSEELVKRRVYVRATSVTTAER